jgi:hypothetical protein
MTVTVVGLGVLGAACLLSLVVLRHLDELARLGSWLAAAGTWLVNLSRRTGNSIGRYWTAQRLEGGIVAGARAQAEDAPDLVRGRPKIRWKLAGTPSAEIVDGEVVVRLTRSRHPAENLAAALTTYLPKALIPTAREHVHPKTMQAVDLVFAKGMVAATHGLPLALEVLNHAENARSIWTERGMESRVRQIDRIDLHGWMVRILLPEFQRVAGGLAPGFGRTPELVEETSRFAGWLYRLATRLPGEYVPLSYPGRYFRVAIVMVGNQRYIDHHGIAPHFSRAKTYMYRGGRQVVYLLARDDKIPYARDVLRRLRRDGKIATAHAYEYRLRQDFTHRVGLERSHAIVACVRVREQRPPEYHRELLETKRLRRLHFSRRSQRPRGAG